MKIAEERLLNGQKQKRDAGENDGMTGSREEEELMKPMDSC